MNKATRHEVGEGLTVVTEREQMVKSVAERERNSVEEGQI